MPGGYGLRAGLNVNRIIKRFNSEGTGGLKSLTEKCSEISAGPMAS